MHKRLRHIVFCFFLITQLQAQDSTISKTEPIDRKTNSVLSPDKIIEGYKNSLTTLSDTSRYSIQWPAFSLPKLSLKQPLQINGGNIAYYYDYRSSIDTPYQDKNISQHSIVGQVNVTLFKALPLSVSFFLRRTNSSLYTDINDVRIDFNAAQYAQSVGENYIKQLKQKSPNIKGTLLKQLKNYQSFELDGVMSRINKTDFRQRLIECNEILNVPAIAESIAGSAKADSVRQKAREFIEAYNFLKGKEVAIRSKIDSLQKLIENTVAKGKAMQEVFDKGVNTAATPEEAMNLLRRQGVTIPASVRHLLALRRFSLGHSQLNYSELTARNLSINGINLEYNSWYYFALAAGTVDYRFRDFILNNSNRKPQYMYLVRLGVGKLEKNYIILSAYKGQKQDYLQNNSNSGRSSGLTIYGMSLETKYRINRNSYIVTEIAQSSTPGVDLYEGQKTSSFLNWSNKINKAYAIKLFTFFPKTRTRLEAMYRYSGAAFQSFDRFQANSARENWYIKAEQSFWKRQFRLTASLRSNEFSNPYITVPYTNSTVSKSVQLTFRKKNWPVLSAGLMPFSQLSVVNDQIYENRFHTLNAVFYHQYKVGDIRTSTTATYNRFYNKAEDTGFVYFNSVNFYIQQYLYFRKFTLSAGGAHSVNTGFELNSLEESVQAELLKNSSITVGVKVTNYNKAETKVGSWFRLGYRFMRTGVIQVHYENGLLPSNQGKLIRNQLCSIVMSKTF